MTSARLVRHSESRKRTMDRLKPGRWPKARTRRRGQLGHEFKDDKQQNIQIELDFSSR